MTPYLLVKKNETGQSQGQAIRMPLPVSVGTSPFANIIINSQALLPVSYEIDVDDEDPARLKIISLKEGGTVAREELGRLGITVRGPFRADAAYESPWRRRVSEWLVLEQQWFDRQPENVRNWLGGRFSQRGRLAGWTAVTMLGLALISFFTGSKAVAPDLSNQPQPLQAGVLSRNLYGASPTRVGFEQGILFQVSGMSAERKHQLRFEIGGLDEDREVEVFFNGVSLYATKADVSCVESFCSRSVILPEPGAQTDLFFKHNGGGTYLIKNILVQEVLPLTPAEIAMTKRWLDSARRAWADRSVSAENIVLASEMIARAEELAGARSDGQALLTEIQVLKQEVRGSFAEIVRDMTFKVRKDLKLGEIEEARKTLQLMLRLYPDPAHAEHRRLKNLLKETEAMQ